MTMPCYQLGPMRLLRHPGHDQTRPQRHGARQHPIRRSLHGHDRVHGGGQRAPRVHGEERQDGPSDGAGRLRGPHEDAVGRTAALLEAHRGGWYCFKEMKEIMQGSRNIAEGPGGDRI